jgi:hypothetical protein
MIKKKKIGKINIKVNDYRNVDGDYVVKKMIVKNEGEKKY